MNYPGLLERVKALIADSVCIILFMMTLSYLYSSLDNVSDTVRKISFLFVFFLYDPIFTSTFGGTIGHMIIGLRVKKQSEYKQNINLFQAILRYIVKALLGWLSLLTVLSNKEKRAIHDLASGSIILYKSENEQS